MAVWYVRNSATGANNGTSWTNAYTTFSAAMTACAAGDTVYIADDHIGTLASVNKGTLSSPLSIIAAKPTATPPTSAADPGTYATLSWGADFSTQGVVYFYGISFITNGIFYLDGDSMSSNFHFENCKFTPGGFLALNNRQPSYFNYSCQVRFTNCELYAPFNSYNYHIRSLGGGTFIWRGGSHTRNPAIATSPTVVMTGPSFYDIRKWEINGVDFSPANWATPPQIASGGMEFGKLNVTNCKLQSGQRIVNGGGHWSNGRISVSNTLHTQFTSSGGASYSSRTFTDSYYHSAHMDSFTDSRIKTAPLSAISIAQPSSQRYSYVSDTASSATFSYVYARFDAPIYFWNDVVGTPITITLNMFIKAGTLTTDARRIEVQYPGDSGSPRTVIVRTGNDVTSHINLGPPFGSAGTFTGTADTSWIPTFATEGGWPPHYHYNFSVTITPQAKGFIRLRYAKHGPLSEHQQGSTNFNPRPLIS